MTPDTAAKFTPLCHSGHSLGEVERYPGSGRDQPTVVIFAGQGRGNG